MPGFVVRVFLLVKKNICCLQGSKPLRLFELSGCLEGSEKLYVASKARNPPGFVVRVITSCVETRLPLFKLCGKSFWCQRKTRIEAVNSVSMCHHHQPWPLCLWLSFFFFYYFSVFLKVEKYLKIWIFIILWIKSNNNILY